VSVLYSDGRTAVLLGDVVSYSAWIFLRREGVVDYVPGISSKNPQMEYGGLTWVSISSGDRRVQTIVDPDSSCLKKSVHFIRRGELSDEKKVKPGDLIDDPY